MTPHDFAQPLREPCARRDDGDAIDLGLVADPADDPAVDAAPGREPARSDGCISLAPVALPPRRGRLKAGASGELVVATALEVMSAARIEPEDAHAAWPWRAAAAEPAARDALATAPRTGAAGGDTPGNPPGHAGTPDFSGPAAVQPLPANADAFSDPSPDARAHRAERALRQHPSAPRDGDRHNGFTGLAA